MAEGLNRVLLIGNLGQDPELKFIQSGQAVLKMRLATSESYKDKSGERQEKTEWHTVVLWGKRAEALGKILVKGKSIAVEGRIQTRSWEDKEGQRRYATEINATNVVLLGGGGKRGESAASEPAGQDSADAGGDDFGEIPF